MMRGYMIIVVLCSMMIMLTGVPAMAQEDEMPSAQVMVEIEQAELNLTADGGYALTMQGILGSGCDLPVEISQTVEGGTLFVDVYQLIPVDVFCPMVIVSYADTVPLDVPTGVGQVVVNDAYTFDLPGAQTAPDEDVQRVYGEVEAVELGADGVLTVQGFHPDGCAFDVVVDALAQGADWVLIDIYRDVPLDVACPMMIVPYEVQIDLNDLSFLPDVDAEPVSLDVAALALVEINERFFGVVADGELIEAERELMQVVDVRGDDVPTGFAPELVITGGFDDVCLSDVRWRVRPDDDDPTQLDVLVYRIVTPDDVCDGRVLDYDVTVSFPDALDSGRYLYTINGDEGDFGGAFVLLRRAPVDRALLFQRSLYVIEEASVMVEGENVILSVVGYAPDGCEARAQIDVERRDEQIDVEIYREIPAGVMCPMVIMPFADEFELGILAPGDYTLNVNGVFVSFSVVRETA